ncbi:MAG: hypothetical protein HYW07_12390 [Candidatus Latescibacteria bacterium]|nr:hypothetical protein [Candidatus Latescibacterota bacterium]
MTARIKTIRSSWWEGYGYRLDCQPYLAGALETKIILEGLALRKDRLQSLTKGHAGGIYNGPQFARHYVESLEYGVPFLGSASMLYADLSGLPLLSRKQALSDKLEYLEIKRGMTLISCSGTIGKTVYARPEMEGMWSSQHIMKVVPDPGKIPPGYLYAFLSSKFGVPLVVSGTYGSIIQEIEPEHLTGIPVPRLDEQTELEIHALVERAAALRTEASKKLNENSERLLTYLKFPPLKKKTVSEVGWTSIPHSELDLRLDAHYHSASAYEVERLVRECHVGYTALKEVTTRLFKPPMFKRLWVDDPDFGTQFVSGIDAYCLRSNDPRYVSLTMKGYDEFVLHRGWVIFQAAGSIYGLFGRPLYVRGWLEGLFCADDLYRIVPHTEEDGAFLYAYFRTPHGRVSIQRESAGHAIPRVWDPQMFHILVPWPKEERVRKDFAEPVIAAHDLIEQARQAEDMAILSLEQTIESM